MNPAASYSPGLEGIIAGETSISTVEEGLSYRGYPVPELGEKCSFDEVAYLLIYGELPTAAQLERFQVRVNAARRLTQPIRDLLIALPKWTPPLEALRTTVSALAHFDQDAPDNSHESNVRKAERLVAQLPVAICDHYHFSRGENPIAARQDLGQAANFLWMLRGVEPKPDDVRALDVSLTLYAEHEFNASTFAARTIVSTESDLHSAIVGAIGALKGRLHGGANEKIMDILKPIGEVDKAEAWVKNALAKKERIMGFGHRVYKAGDVRAGILKKFAHDACERIGEPKWEQIAQIIEDVMAAEKKMYPNLDWPAGRLYYALGLDVPLYTPIFAMSRVSGWSAHVIEQIDNNRLIRPRALYNGPERRHVKALAERG